MPSSLPSKGWTWYAPNACRDRLPAADITLSSFEQIRSEVQERLDLRFRRQYSFCGTGWKNTVNSRWTCWIISCDAYSVKS